MAKIFVIDDDYDLVEALREVLSCMGCEVVTAPNGARALETLHQGFRPDFILCDLRMPVMDGREFCLKVKTDPTLRQIPIHLFSNESNVAAVAQEVSAAGYIRKGSDTADDILALCQRMAA